MVSIYKIIFTISDLSEKKTFKFDENWLVTCIIVSKTTFIIFKTKIVEWDFDSEYLIKIDYFA